MESIALVLTLAFVAGLIFRKLGYPPLLGYLITGFACHGLKIGSADQLASIANLGVTLLLFTIGLKLRFDVLMKRYIVGPALIHMLLVVPLTAAVIMLAGMIYIPLSFDNSSAPWTLAFALSFSSTVFAIKIFEERGESQSFHAAITIGVLVIQDVLAVGFLVIASGQMPSAWTLVIIAGIFLHRLWAPGLNRLLNHLGHGELQLLFGITAALASYELFEYVHLKGGLGALVAGAMLAFANPSGASELYKRLVNLKGLLLVGFFLQIGYAGLPSTEMLTVAAVLSLLLMLRPVIYFSLFTLLRLRARTATLAGGALTSYSEFGLIVAALAAAEGLISDEWLVTLALAIALSFFIATPINKQVHRWYRIFSDKLLKHEKARLPEEKIEKLENSRIVLLGMGRVGRGAYHHLTSTYGDSVVGVEENYERTLVLKQQGIRCIHGDASDQDFWEQAGVANCEILLVSLSNHQEHLSVTSMAREMGFTGTIAVTSRFDDEARALEQLGCVAFNVYKDVGRGFAETVIQDKYS